jgi:hypothetical protein
MKEILYCKNKAAFGYKKISAIKDVGYNWGEGELNKKEFGVLSVNISQDKIISWENENKYCVNDAGTAIIETPIEYQAKEEFINPLEIPKE